MKIAINVQEENWEDDGGAHDPFVIDLDLLAQTDAALADMLKAGIAEGEDALPILTSDQASALGSDDIRVKSFPCEISGAMAVWFSYG